ncbi:N-acetyltransferase family protein [Acetobacterium sp.]|uniref:GNAT family N-acetyltransferase n=1 Tax=Acetobacterium sp. TaxID=1872094 RepID=UPI0035936FD2
MKDYSIREITPREIPLLDDFLYEAIFQPDEQNQLPRDVIKQPELQVYIENFGEPDDHCLVAECDDKIVGAVWTRILAGKVRGFRNVDDKTPEFAISLYQEYRNCGIGTALMKRMLQHLTSKGYRQVSLVVQKDNYALSMYLAVGFCVIDELDQEYLMICQLDGESMLKVDYV